MHLELSLHAAATSRIKKHEQGFNVMWFLLMPAAILSEVKISMEDYISKKSSKLILFQIPTVITERLTVQTKIPFLYFSYFEHFSQHYNQLPTRSLREGGGGGQDKYLMRKTRAKVRQLVCRGEDYGTSI